jgi:hypothetical protein
MGSVGSVRSVGRMKALLSRIDILGCHNSSQDTGHCNHGKPELNNVFFYDFSFLTGQKSTYIFFYLRDGFFVFHKFDYLKLKEF